MGLGGEDGADSGDLGSSSSKKVKKETTNATHDDSNASPPDSPQVSHEDDDDSSRPTLPLQKRRRVTRACDECRRKKIKCDGKQPCTHCTVYSYECTYDQPSNRRRNAPPQYVESLEQQLKRANAILHLLIPNVDLNDPELEMKLRQFQFSPSPLRSTPATSINVTIPEEHDSGGCDQLESMVQATGALDLDEQGNFEYHGHSSGLHFLRRMRESLGDVMGPEPKSTPFIKSRPMSTVIDSPRSTGDSPLESLPGSDLPPRAIARELCDIAINDAGALLRIVHYPTFISQMERLYDVSPENYGNDENMFLPLFYAVLAVATLFAKTDSNGQEYGYEAAITEGFKYFKQSRQLMDIADCRDLRQLQALVFMILFLQSSAKLSVCYAYIGVALRSALRMGLHRCFTKNFNPIEAETRKRIFWVIRKMDTYVGALLGLPHSLNEEEIDQEYPTEVDDEYITETEILPMPEGKISLMTAANAHTKLVQILAKIVKYIYPPKASTRRAIGTNTYSVSYAKIVEIERDLQKWQDSLPMNMKPGGDATKTMQRCQHMLRLAYGHAQMMLYRPFLHYVSQTRETRNVDKRSYACAAACVSVSRNIVHIAIEMKKRGLLQGAYWFTMYTTFFAILSLVFYALENPESESSQEVLKAATEAKNALEALAKRSLAADRCAATLKALFQQLPQHAAVSRKSSVGRKRRQISPHRRTQKKNSLNVSADVKTPHSTAAMIAANNTMAQNYNLAELQYATSNGFFDMDSKMTSNPDPLSISFSPTTQTFNDSPPTMGDNFPLADLSAMMFPNPDPLAYPTQPTDNNVNYEALFKDIPPNGGALNAFPDTLGMQQTRPSTNPGNTGTSSFIPPSTFMYQSSHDPSNMSQDGEVPLLGPMPMYMMQGDSNTRNSNTPTSSTFPPATSSPLHSNSSINGHQNHPFGTPQHHNLQRNKLYSSNHPRNIQLDSLLGNEEWNGLPADRIPGAGAYVNPQSGAREGPFTGKIGGAASHVTTVANGQVQFGDLTPELLGWGLEGF